MSSKLDFGELIPLGKVLRIHGIRGKVKIAPFGNTLEGLSAGQILYLHDEKNKWRSLVVDKIQRQPKFVIASFRGILSREQAEFLKGKEIFLPVSQLPVLEEGEYYYYQLIGLRVERISGESLGEITDIIETGSNDVYVVSDGNKEVLIPALEDVVVEVDLENRKMKVDLPEGLID